jgi:hypothetical protein
MAMVASDKLFYWLFQAHPDRILELQRDLPAESRGWRFCAPVVKEREHRLDGLFQPPADQAALRPERPPGGAGDRDRELAGGGDLPQPSL